MALNGIDLDIHMGEAVMRMGPSGSGKTTLVSIMRCILRPTSGQVQVAGEEVGHLKEKDLPRIRLQHLGFIFQGYNLFPCGRCVLQWRFPKAMERATKLLSQYRFANRCVSSGELVQAVWTRAVGKKIAEHSSIRGLWNGKLVVHVDDALWRDNLTTLRGQILLNLTKLAGAGMVRDIEFRVGVPKRAPVREARVAGASDDGIEDPILSLIYRAAKKRATA